jgi:hypothetical protein
MSEIGNWVSSVPGSVLVGSRLERL